MVLHCGNQTHFDVWLHDMVAEGNKIQHQHDGAQETTENILSGYIWGDEYNPKSSNGGPPTCDN